MSTQTIHRSESRPEAAPTLSEALKAADESALYRPKLRMPQVSAFELETLGPLPQCLTRNTAPDIFETSSAEMARVLESMPLDQLFSPEFPPMEARPMAQAAQVPAEAAAGRIATGLRPEAPRQRAPAPNPQHTQALPGTRLAPTKAGTLKRRALASVAFVLAAGAAMAAGLYAARHFHDGSGPGMAVAASDPAMAKSFSQEGTAAVKPAASEEVRPLAKPEAEVQAAAAETKAPPAAEAPPMPVAEPARPASQIAAPASADMDKLTNDVVQVLSKMGTAGASGTIAASDPEELRAALKNLVGESAKVGQSTDEVIQRLDAMLAGQPAAALPVALTNGEGVVDTAMLVRSVSAAPAVSEKNYLSMIEQEGGATVVQGSETKIADGFLMEGGERYLIVQKGESLSHIAFRAYGDPMVYPKIMRANRDVLKQGDLLTIGMKLKVPS